jgi:ribosomal protein S18 acetylase RimI-like enzyme
MAARPDYASAEIVDLRHLRGSDLAPLLDEEISAWRRRLHWDFSASAELVRRYVDMHALAGYALWINRRIAGYCYHVLEDTKALIGDLFVLDPLATPEVEHQLLESVIGDVVRQSAVRRIEAQLMMLRHPPNHARLRRRFGRLEGLSFPRHFMLAKLAGLTGKQRAIVADIEIAPWSEHVVDDAAGLIATAYEGHLDSQINDQYLHAGGARRFLSNIVLYPGCGAFFAPGSVIALDRSTRKLCGLSLASIVGLATGHITQICVAPASQQQGIGYELLLRSLSALAEADCREVTLTVTAGNSAAVQLYERLGFGVLRDFAAHVWVIR